MGLSTWAFVCIYRTSQNCSGRLLAAAGGKSLRQLVVAHKLAVEFRHPRFLALVRFKPHACREGWTHSFNPSPGLWGTGELATHHGAQTTAS